MKEKENELETLLAELENQKRISAELQKEFLLSEIRNELLTHIVSIFCILD